MRRMNLADVLIFVVVLAADVAVLVLLRRRRRKRVARERMQFYLRLGLDTAGRLSPRAAAACHSSSKHEPKHETQIVFSRTPRRAGDACANLESGGASA